MILVYQASDRAVNRARFWARGKHYTSRRLLRAYIVVHCISLNAAAHIWL